MQNRSNLPAEYSEYPVGGALMSFCAEWTQTWDAPGYLSSRHFHPYAELGLCLDGCGLFFVEDRVYPFSRGTVIYIPADMPHIEENSPRRQSSWKYLWVDDRLFGGGDVLSCLPSEAVTQERSCRHMFEMLYDEVSGKKEDTVLYISLCTAFARMMARTLVSDRKQSANEAREKIAPAISYIADHYSEEITVSYLAEKTHLSESTLKRAFSEATGQTPYAYICLVRLAAAENLLIHTDLPILEISSACGFNSLSSFNRQFKKANGLTPSNIRGRGEKQS